MVEEEAVEEEVVEEVVVEEEAVEEEAVEEAVEEVEVEEEVQEEAVEVKLPAGSSRRLTLTLTFHAHAHAHANPHPHVLNSHPHPHPHPHPNQVREIVDLGVEINGRDAAGRTALHVAAQACVCARHTRMYIRMESELAPPQHTCRLACMRLAPTQILPLIRRATSRSRSVYSKRVLHLVRGTA